MVSQHILGWIDGELDETDWIILQLVQANARMSFAEIGRRTGLSAPAAAERLRRLEDAGIIVGYHAQVCAEKIGYQLMAFIRVATTSEQCPIVSAFVAQLPEVLECHRVTGSDSFIIKVTVASIEHLESVIDQLTPYVATTTSIVLSSAVSVGIVERFRVRSIARDSEMVR